jgi:hypothetical protein
MEQLSMNLGADRHDSMPRYWSVVSCPRCGGAVLIEHTAPDDPHAELLNAVPEHGAAGRADNVPEALREYYDDAIRVLEAVGACASDVDETTGRRALQYSTQVLRRLFEIPTDPAPPSGPVAQDEPE